MTDQPQKFEPGPVPSADGSAASWEPCAAGELHTIAKSHLARQRKEKLIQVANRNAWVLLVVALGCWGWGLGSGAIATLSCAECEAQFAALEAHFLGETPLPKDQLAAVAQHMHDCNFCPAKFEILHPDAAGNKEQLLLKLKQFTHNDLSHRAPLATIIADGYPLVPAH